jgi:nitrilase
VRLLAEAAVEGLWEQSVDVPGPFTELLAAACAEHGIVCAIGVNERESARPGTLYDTLVVVGPTGCCAGHRELMPTM